MTSVSFCYWLQGLFEIGEVKILNEKQVDIIKNHLNMVFFHEIDPALTPDKKKQQSLNQIHNGLPTEFLEELDKPGVMPIHTTWNKFPQEEDMDLTLRC